MIGTVDRQKAPAKQCLTVSLQRVISYSYRTLGFVGKLTYTPPLHLHIESLDMRKELSSSIALPSGYVTIPEFTVGRSQTVPDQ